MLEPGTGIVLAIRLLGPLMIFRWPLLGSILSQYVFDAVDILIWAVAGADINYTFYDKPLDAYQFTIQAIVASRWEDKTVRNVTLFLYGYRFLGYVLYLLTDLRVMFFFFPNVFFPFFVAYLGAIKLGLSEWFENRRKLSIVLLVITLLKLPQEFILHWPDSW